MGAMSDYDLALRQARGGTAGRSRISAPPPGVVVWVSYWWPGYDPSEALSWHYRDLAQFAISGRATDAAGTHWQWANASLATVYDWATEHGYAVLDYRLLRQRHRGGHWEGLYAVAIGRAS